MKKLLSILLLLPNLLFAQTSYNDHFKSVINDIEKNYAGFLDKVENKKEFYDFLKTKLLKDSLTDIDQLRAHINKYISFFGDNHIYIRNFNVKSISFADSLIKRRDKIFQFEVLDENTCYLKIGSFIDVKNLVGHFVNYHIDTILQKKNLIIDIRGNGGGGDGAFSSLLPIIATDNIYVRNAYFFATHVNWNYLKNDLEIDIGTWNDSLDNKFISLPWVPDSSFIYKTYSCEAVDEFPKHVAVLVDRKVASSGEQFVFCAKQSFKVKIFGENTSGTIDYSMLRPTEVIKDSLYVTVPTIKLKGLPVNQIDKHGIAPDFYLKPENQIEQILNYFENWN